ncbi:thioredoxin fold domain-containing protein [Helicobacter sp. MIT 01-3238]|uniref:thioredoxin family protein n=1 Tax=Helicobacter sp. MIT 01-3238 TaxID=398627 RepID=UPI000E1F2001|nr:thioredoxin fold domain-containing protein [Helicobacter sp. MIT 01-3238]RDU52644.1 hypothetical protein CQA40_06860 [Helicobacter sp. MIT 01-3238]
MPKNIICQYRILGGARNRRYRGKKYSRFSRIFCFFVMLASRGSHRDEHIAIFMIFFLLMPLLALCGCQNTQDSKNTQGYQAHNADYESSIDSSLQSSTQSKLDFAYFSDFAQEFDKQIFDKKDFDKRDFDRQDFEFFDKQNFTRLDSSDKGKSGLDDLSINDLLGGLSSGNQVFLQDLTIPAKDSTSSTRKPILLFFGSPFCTPCKHIIQNIAESKTLQEMLKSRYQAYFINILSKESLQINLPSLIKKTQQKTTQKSAQKITPQSSAEFLITKKSLAHTLNIRATPTLLFLDNSGEEIFRFVGGLSKEHLLIALDFLKSPPTSNNQQQIALELHKRFLAQNK